MKGFRVLMAEQEAHRMTTEPKPCCLDDCGERAFYNWDGKPLCRQHGDELLTKAKAPPTLLPWHDGHNPSDSDAPKPQYSPSEGDWDAFSRVTRWLVAQNLDWLKEMAKK